MKFTQVLKWVGICDATLIAAAVTFGKAYPPAAPYVADVVQVAGFVSTLLAGYAHVTAGTNAGRLFVDADGKPKP